MHGKNITFDRIILRNRKYIHFRCWQILSFVTIMFEFLIRFAFWVCYLYWYKSIDFFFFSFRLIEHLYIDLQKHAHWTTISHSSIHLSNPRRKVLIFTSSQTMDNGCRENVRERKWPLNNLSTISENVCTHTKGKKRVGEGVERERERKRRCEESLCTRTCEHTRSRRITEDRQ